MSSLNEVNWDEIPAPSDDGGADHLTGRSMPDVVLAAHDGTTVNVSSPPGLTVMYAYPMTGRPGHALPDGWDAIPGARGCTPQSCSFRDHLKELQDAGVTAVFGVSTQSQEEQNEAATRLELPFLLLSDADLKLADSLKLPTFEVEGRVLLRRLSLVIEHHRIIKVFYPVFPPDINADLVLSWLKTR